MASTILTRTISSVTDNRIVLSNSNFARPFNISSWTTLRIALRLIMNNTGANLTGTPRFAVGLCSGQSNIFLDATTTHFAGIVTYETTWQYLVASAGNMTKYSDTAFGTMLCRAAKRVGTTLTGSAGGFDGPYFPADATTATRRLYFVDITKGSPNYTFTLFCCNSFVASPDVSVNDFNITAPASSPTLTHHATFAGGITLAVDEGVDGVFDNVNIAWNQSSPTFEICDLAVVKLA